MYDNFNLKIKLCSPWFGLNQTGAGARQKTILIHCQPNLADGGPTYHKSWVGISLLC